MQSHASRHVVSEYLEDLHPDLSPPTPQAVILDEIAAAYGRRSIPKLISVLALDGLSDEERSHALRVFNGMLSTQEQKSCAISEGAAPPLTSLVSQCGDAGVRRLCCEALSSLASIIPGRQAVVEAGGIVVLTGALQTTPEAAADALRAFSISADGVALLAEQYDSLVPALVALMLQPKADGISTKAYENAAATLAGITVNDAGILAALKAGVPASLVHLSIRALTGDLKFDPNAMPLLEQCATGLKQIAHHAQGKTAVRMAEGITVLGSMIALEHRPTVKHASCALAAVSIEKESKVPVAVHAGKPLVKLLKGTDTELVANARMALASSAEHLEARKLVELLMVEMDRIQLLFRGPEPPTPPDYRMHIALPYGQKDSGFLAARS